MPESKFGFVVYNERGPQSVGYYPTAPDTGVLRLAYSAVTAFPTRRAALSAIRRTQRWVKKTELVEWDIEYHIARLDPPPGPLRKEPRHAR